MDKDLDEEIKGFQLSLEESEKVLLYNHVNGSSRLVLGRKALEFSCFWFSEYLTIILRNRAEYRLILSRQGRRPSRLKSDDIPRD